MADVKGVLVSGTRAFLLNRYGKPAIDRVLATMPSTDSARINRPFLESSFYPYATMESITVLIHGLGSIRRTTGQELGRFLAEYVFKGPYKPMLTSDVPRMVEKIAAIKDFFYRDTNAVESAMTGDASAKVIYRYQNGVRPTKGLCRSLGAFWGHALELSGNVKVSATHPTCMAEGADRCEFVYAW